MSSVVYIKLLTGEELIGSLSGDDGVTMTVTEPLAMESGLDDDDPSRRYVFMSRFSPYSADPHISIKHAAIAFHVPVSTTVARYYEVSLRYCSMYTDPKFIEGIQDTTDQIEVALKDDEDKAETEKPKKKELLSESARELLTRALTSGPTSNTCH